MKILRLASSDDHDYDHSDYTEMMTDQYLIQLILKKCMKKKYHSWVLSHTVGKANGITLQTDEQQDELIAHRLTAGGAFDHERNTKTDNKHCTNEKQSSADKKSHIR